MSNTNLFGNLAVMVADEPAVIEVPTLSSRLDASNDFTQRVGKYSPTTLADLHQHALDIEQERKDYTVKVGSLHFYPEADAVRMWAGSQDSDNGLPMTFDLALNQRAMDQVCDFLTVSHTAPVGRYLAGWDANTRAELLQKHVAKHVNTGSVRKSWLFRSLLGQARATLSTSYATIENSEIIAKLNEAIAGQNLPDFRLTTSSYVSPDAMRIDSLWQNVPGLRDSNGGGYGVGISVKNDLVGAGSYRLCALVKRHSCDNSIVVDADESQIKIAHFGKTARAAVLGTMHAYIHALIVKSGHAVVELAKAEQTPIEVPDWSQLFAATFKDLSLSDAEKQQALIGTEGKRTVGGLVNSITYAAHQTEKMSDERSYELQHFAGEMLFRQDKLIATARAVAESVHARQ